MLTSSPVARRGLCTWPLAPSHVPSCSGCLSTLWTDVFQVHPLSSPPTACHWHPETHTAVLGGPATARGSLHEVLRANGTRKLCLWETALVQTESDPTSGAGLLLAAPPGENLCPATACLCPSSTPSAQLLCPLCPRCPGRRSQRACGLPVSPAEGVLRAPASNVTLCSLPSVWLQAYCLIFGFKVSPQVCFNSMVI